MVRLFGLLALLGLGLLGLASMPAQDMTRVGAVRTVERPPHPVLPAAAEPIAAEPAVRELPEAVRRLADGPAVGPLRPVVFGEATPIPVAVASVEPTRPDRVSIFDPENPFMRIKAQRANVRAGPSTAFDVIGQVTAGEEVQVLQSEGGWRLIRMEGDGFEGWVSATLLEN